MTASSPGDRASTSEVPAADRWTPATRQAAAPPRAARSAHGRTRHRPAAGHSELAARAPAPPPAGGGGGRRRPARGGERGAAAAPGLTGPVWVAAIDDDAADTAAFTDAYQVPAAASA